MSNEENKKVDVMMAQMKACLPNYGNIFKSIKNMRKISGDFKKYSKEAYDHFPYKNVISIIGERGSGKSTLFNHIRYFLKCEKDLEDNITDEIKDARAQIDINLEIIVPEMLEDGSDILGVILINLKQHIDNNKDKINDYYRNERHSGCTDSFYESCIYDKQNKLETCWLEVFKTYIQRENEFNQVIRENYSSLEDYIKEKERNLSSEIKLGKQIYDLVTEIINVFSDGAKRALLYIYMDDVDISRARCRQAIDTILRYLKHPNIVVFVSGDLKRFERGLLIDEVITQKSYKVSSVLEKDEIKKRDEEYIYEFMKKVMPYANRYYLIKLDNRGKMEFKYEQILEDQSPSTFQGVINKCLLSKVKDKKIKEDKKVEEDKKVKENVSLPEWGYMIFDEKPRGLISVWEFVQNNFPLSKDEDLAIKRSIYRDLLRIIIDTNPLLREKEDYLCYEIIRISNNEQGISLDINYDKFLNDIYREENLTVSQKEMYIVALHLFYFLEVIINEDHVSTNRYSRILNAIINKDGKDIYPIINNVKKILQLFAAVREKFSLEVQPLIYSREEYFNSFSELVQDPSLHLDLSWHRNFEEVNKLFSAGDIKIKQELMEIFKDFDYEQEVLLNNAEG